jgi:hypothetical protein
MDMPEEMRQRAMEGSKILTASVDILCYGIFILVNQILGDILQHELVDDGGHPGVHERSQIQQRLAVQNKLVMNQLIGRFCIDSLKKHQSQVYGEHR